MNNILVTGASGFVGSGLVRRLLSREGVTLTVLQRSRPPGDFAPRVRWVQADVADAAAVSAACAGIDTVFHTAARVGVSGRWADFHRPNVLGTEAVIAGCRRHGVRRLVFTSSPSVVYNGRDLAGVDETAPLTTRELCPTPYGPTKALAERAVLAADSPELRTVALRPHLIWGPGDRHLVPRLLARARSGRLRIVGEGRNRVDFTHIENCLDAHLRAAELLAAGPGPCAGRAYFLSDDAPVVLWEFINRLLAVHGLPPCTKRLSLPAALRLGGVLEAGWNLLRLAGEPPMTRFLAKELATDHWFDISAARRDLGYRPRVDVEAGLAGLKAAASAG